LACQVEQFATGSCGGAHYWRFWEVAREKQIKAEARYDGCCVANTVYNAETVAHVYLLSAA
jgi:hypothetical protein